MGKIIFSSWQEELVDNRKAEEKDRKHPANVPLPSEFRPGERIKAFMGWDGIVLCDDDVDIVDMCAKYAEAVQEESCGKCFPCRVGTRIVSDWLKKIAAGEGKEEDIARIRDLALPNPGRSKCSIGQTGMNPILHALKHFPQAFADAIAQGGKRRKAGTVLPSRPPASASAPAASIFPGTWKRSANSASPNRWPRSGRASAWPGPWAGSACVPANRTAGGRISMKPISIKYLKRFVADYEIDKNRHPEIAGVQRTGRKVAVIGAGPAGFPVPTTWP